MSKSPYTLPVGKTDKKPTKPRSDLQLLNGEVQFCINFRIQRARRPYNLNCSEHTIHLYDRIAYLQAELVECLKEDYRRQRAEILSKRD